MEEKKKRENRNKRKDEVCLDMTLFYLKEERME